MMDIIKLEDLRSYTDLELQNINARLHAYWRDMEDGVKDYNREELVNQYVWVLQEMKSRDMKHKVRDQLDVEALTLLNKSSYPLWLSIFPTSESKQLIYEIQDALELDRSDKNDEDSLHITLQLCNDIANVSDIRRIVANVSDIRRIVREEVADSELSFKVDGLDIWGDEEKVIVLTGILLPAVPKLIEVLREKFPECIKDYDFNPHIILGGADSFILPSSEYLDSLNSLVIKLDKPMLIVSLSKNENIALSYIPEDENEIENIIYQNLQDEINKRLDPKFSEALSNVKDLVVLPDIVSVSGSSVDPDNEEPNDIDLVWRINWDNGKAEIDLRNILMKFDRAFPKSIQDKFQHISSPQGPNWSSIPLADLILRFHSDYEGKYLDESYAYYKNKAMSDTTGSGGEFVGERWWKGDLKNKFKEYIDKCEELEDFNVEELFDIFTDLLYESLNKQEKGKEVELMKPFDALKSRAGYHKNEFFVGEEENVWRSWASPYLEGS